MLTIAETIQVGKLSIGLAVNSVARGALFGGKLAPNSPLTMAMATSALEWGNVVGQDAEDLRGLADYAYWIYGKQGLQAQYLIGISSGGGTVVPGGGLTRPNQLNFTVAASGTTLIDGQSTVTLPSGWTGFNVVVNKNGQALTQITSAPIYYTWDSTTRLLTVSPAAFLGDEFQITPA